MITVAPPLDASAARASAEAPRALTQAQDAGLAPAFALLLELALGSAPVQTPAGAAEATDTPGAPEALPVLDIPALAAAYPVQPLAPTALPQFPAASGQSATAPAGKQPSQPVAESRPQAAPLDAPNSTIPAQGEIPPGIAPAAMSLPPAAPPPGVTLLREERRAAEPAAVVMGSPEARPVASDALPAQHAPRPAAAAPGGTLRREEPRAAEPAGVFATAPEASPALFHELPGQHAPQPAVPQALTLRVAAPIAAPEFGEAFAARVTVAVQAGTESASIQVAPPELGPVAMRVSILEGEAHVQFAAESPVAREAIADALPRLRDMLAAQGLALAGSSVGAELPRREARAESLGSPAAAQPAAIEPETQTAALRAELRLVDIFV